MHAFTRLCGAASVAVVLVSLSGSAEAQRTGAQVLGLETLRSGVSVAGLLGIGFDIEDDSFGDLNPYGFGLGVRGGYTLPDVPFYVGGTFIYHLGDSESAGALGTRIAEASLNYTMLGGEVGYDLLFDQVTIRPYLGLGANIVSYDCEPDVCGDSDAELYFSLGGSLLFYLTQNIFLGGDMRLSFVTDAPDGIQLFGTAGAQF